MNLKTYSIKKWCELFGVEILDNDGFQGFEMTTEIPLHTFIDGISVCTIQPTSKELYKILDYLIKIL